MEDMEKSQESFLQGAQQELRKEMATLQKKILMDTVGGVSEGVSEMLCRHGYSQINHLLVVVVFPQQQQEMATVRKSLQSMLF